MCSSGKARSRGYTLVELVVSMSVGTVLMGGLASAVMLASRAIPDAQSPLSTAIEGYFATEQIANELLCAQSFTERTASAVTFSVADRDSDTVAETIRYAWSGTPGDTLTRQYNAGTPTDIVLNLHQFALSYSARTETTTTTQTTQGQSAEIDLASFDGWGGVIPDEFLPSSSRWLTECFQITPLPDVTTINIARVKLMMRIGNPDPTATVSAGIHRAVAPGDPTPQPTPIGTPAVVLTSTLPASAMWVDFTFSDVVIDTSETEYVVVVKGSTLGTGYLQQYYWNQAPADTTALMWTTDMGASWFPRLSERDDHDMPFHIYGTYETETTQEITTSRYFLESVRIALRIGPDQPTTAETAVQILNAPEVTGP